MRDFEWEVQEEGEAQIAVHSMVVGGVLCRWWGDAEPEGVKQLKDIETLQNALRESVKLQSHYAGILNSWDGGERKQFENAEKWIERLEAMKNALSNTEDV